MLSPALRLDTALYSTSMAYDLSLPIVALPIIVLPVVALSISSPTCLHYEQFSIRSKTADRAEAGFEGQEVAHDACHYVRFLRDLECRCKRSPFFGIRERRYAGQRTPRVFDRDVTYGKVIDYRVLS